MAVRRTRGSHSPQKPDRSSGFSRLLLGLLGAVITAAGAGLLWLAYIWSFDVEADSAVGVRIGNVRVGGSDSVDVIGVLLIGLFGLVLAYLGVKAVIGAFKGAGIR
ncbi:MAG: hypothetical protein R2826_03290 [Thermoleophilia bacterium]